MQRGSRIFQSIIFEDLSDSITVSPPERKGRSEALIKERNELLLCRYYYYTRICERNLPTVYKLLRKELFLEERTIADTIQRYSSRMHELKKQKPTVKFFKEKFPWMVWMEMKTF